MQSCKSHAHILLQNFILQPTVKCRLRRIYRTETDLRSLSAPCRPLCRQVNLAHNPISEDGTRMLLEALRGNAGLLEINLEGLPLRREDSSLLTDIQAQCPDVKIFRGTAARDANRLQGLRRRCVYYDLLRVLVCVSRGI